MKRLVLEPNGWPCTLAECPAGALLLDGNLCFKSEYRTNGRPDAYNEVGEFLAVELSRMVQPVNPVWQEYEE